MMADSELTSFDFQGTIALGTRLNVYRYEHFLEAINDIHWYPVLANNSIVAIASIHGDIQSPIVSLRDEFATYLQDFVERNGDAFALLFEGHHLYVVTANERELLREYQIPVANNKFMPFNADIVEMQFSSIETVQALIPTSDEPLIAAFSSTPLSASLNVPVVLQGNTMLCWAASVSSKGRFLTGQSATVFNSPHEIARIMGIHPNQGTQIDQKVVALNRVFGIRRLDFFRPPTFDVIMNEIGIRRNPIIVNYYGWAGVHTVVFSGYNRPLNGGLTITYMDPNFGFASVFVPDYRRNAISVGGNILIAEEHIR